MSGNGQPGPPVIAHAYPTGMALLVAEVDRRLAAAGIRAADGDDTVGRAPVSPPSDWQWAKQTCHYAAPMIEAWATDAPKPGAGRHQWLLDRAVRLDCALRMGCLTQGDHLHAREVLAARFTEIVRTTEPRREPRRFEIDPEAWDFGALQTSKKTDDEVRAELGGHEHYGEGTTMEDPLAGETRDDDPHSVWKTVPGGTFIFDRPKEVPAVWGRGERIFWAMGEGLMIAGRQGLGKTTLEGLLIAAMVGIGDGYVLGLPVALAGGPVLLLAMDRPSQVAGSLARQFSEHRDRAILDDKLIIRPGPPPFDLAKRPEILTQMAADLGAVAVFVDSLKDAALGLSDDEVAASYNRARQTLLMSGRQICDLHHIRKSPTATKTKTETKARPTIDDIFGSTWLTAGCGSVILLEGEPGDPVIDLHHVKQPRQEVGSFRVLHDQDAGSLTVEGQVDLVRMAKARGDKGLTISDAAKALFGKENPSRSEKEKARRALNRLVAEGKLICFEGAKGGTDGGVQSVYFYEKPITEPSRGEQTRRSDDHAGCEPENRPRTDHDDHADGQDRRSNDHATDHGDHAPTDHGFPPLFKRGGTDRQSAEEGKKYNLRDGAKAGNTTAGRDCTNCLEELFTPAELDRGLCNKCYVAVTLSKPTDGGLVS